MHPLERLNQVMPFLVMLYLLTWLAQLHASASNLPFSRLESANGKSLFETLKSEFVDVGKEGRRAFAYYDQTQYELVGYSSP